MKIGVITPYYRESRTVLKRCLSSVRLQWGINEVVHYLAADGGGQDWLDDEKVVHLRLPHFGDYGNTPRAIGALLAEKQGCDAFAFLDADCWYEEDHLLRLSELMVNENADVVTCTRNLYRMNGSFLSVDWESNGLDFVDTNCFMVGRRAFPLMASWLFLPELFSVVGDRIFWKCIKENVDAKLIKMARSEKPTINYQTSYCSHYLKNGEHPPKDAKEIVMREGGPIVMNRDEFLELEQQLRQKLAEGL